MRTKLIIVEREGRREAEKPADSAFYIVWIEDAMFGHRVSMCRMQGVEHAANWAHELEAFLNKDLGKRIFRIEVRE